MSGVGLNSFMTHSRFGQVIFTDDFFRSATNGLRYHSPNRRFLHGLFELTLSRLGLPIREESAMREGGAIDVERIMHALGLPTTPDGWAAACIADLTPLLGSLGLPVFGPDCLVIGWGLPPSLLRCIDHSGASYLDIEVDPIRFTAHLHLCARTNDPVIAAALQACRVDEEEIWNHASAIKSFFARRGAPGLFDPKVRTGVFFGQSLVDLSLISDGRSMHPADVIDPLRALASSVDLLVIKPHPYEPALHHLAAIAQAIPNVAWTCENTYALLSAGNVQFACSLSSSVLSEVGYFLKPAKPLIRADRNDADRLPTACSAWMPVKPDIASMSFMAAVCGSVAPPHSAAWPADALDLAFATRWGFDAQSQGLRQLPPIALDHACTFDAASPETAWLSHGWSAPEPWGVWSEGEQACLVIPLPQGFDAAAQTLELHIDGMVYHGRTRSTKVRALVDGIEMQLQNEEPGHDIVFRLSRAADDAQGLRPLVVQFVIDTPKRPCDESESVDSRRLGFGLKGLRVSARTEEALLACA